MMDLHGWLETTRILLDSLDVQGYSDKEELNIGLIPDDNGILLIERVYIPLGTDDVDDLSVVSTNLARRLLQNQERYIVYRLIQEERKQSNG